MTVKTSYAPGEPVWVDVSSSDVDASRAFYGALFGWTAPPGQEQFGGYTSFELDGRKVAGLMPLMEEGQQPSWSCYVATDDAAKTTELVEREGGTVVAPPMAVGDLGTMAVYLDPAGAFFGTWQAGQHVGSELVDVDGSLKWVELTAADPAASAPFYAAVFGWEVRPSEEYVELTLGGQSVAGVADAAQGTSGWLPYFQVADPAARAEQAVGLGGTLVLPLTEWPGGACTIVRDPHGATFGLLRST
jgi:predicted enzyme related to lactoylglutathione lyase